MLAVVDALSHLGGLENLNKQVGLLLSTYFLVVDVSQLVFRLESFYHYHKFDFDMAYIGNSFICTNHDSSLHIRTSSLPVAVIVIVYKWLSFSVKTREVFMTSKIFKLYMQIFISQFIFFSLFLWFSLVKLGAILVAGDFF